MKKMKKILFTSLLYLISIQYTYSQTYATNFTEDDCNGVSHNLFNELDAGNIIVISWIMPCGPCATYSYPAYNAVESFASSHPGKVHFYIADDYANTSCVILNNFATTYNMTNSTIFSNANITMSDYGVDGMPKVVVLGGANHLIYLNKNDDKINYSNVHTAISAAIADGVSLVNENKKNTFEVTTFPNPVINTLTVSYKTIKQEEIKIEIIDQLGKSTILRNNQINIPGYHNEKLNLSSFKNGIYFIKISSATQEQINTVNILN
jgi:hypothetical protein|tara:strand:+ start:363 stop:1157 length:795 start_codon:yes stop_codon:yes gene_type:complete